ncbi:LysE family transporter [Candidatus Woesearchaeota archaeon]|nr:LysE family transporter [Candidatus Woesearchaeota archaeon]
MVLQGLLFGIALNAPMGPTNVELIRRGFKEGWKASALFVLGNMTVFSIYFALIIFGLSYVSKSKVINAVLLAFGVIVLFYLAYDAFLDFKKKKDFIISKKKKGKNHYIDALLISFSNPSLPLVLMGLIGADATANTASLSNNLLLISGMFLGFFVFFVFFILLIQLGKKYIHRRYLKYISLGASLMLGYFGLKFGYSLFLLF